MKLLTSMAIESPKNKGKRFAIGNQLYADRKQVKTLYYLKWMVGGKSHELYYKAGTTLKEARELAEKDLKLVKSGIDPVAYRKEQEAKRMAEVEAQKKEEAEKQKTFAIVANEAYKYYQERGDWLGKSGSRKWRFLVNHVFPTIGDKPIKDITPYDLCMVMESLYMETTSACNKVKTAIRQVFKYYSNVYGLKENPFNAQYEALVEIAKKNRKKGSNHPSIHYSQITEYITKLLGLKSTSSLCMVFSILTATRSQEARLIEWSDIDFENGIYKVQEKNDKVKNNPNKLIYLNTQALELLKKIPHYTDYVFIGREEMKPLTDRALEQVVDGLHEAKKKLDGIGYVDNEKLDENGKPRKAVQHAIARSTFSTWAHENEKNSDVIEANLRHAPIDRYNGAYNRAKYEKPRIKLTQEWGDYCFRGIDLDNYLAKLPTD